MNKENENIVIDLKRLSNNLGYKHITKILKNGVDTVEKKLHGEVPLEEGETIKELQSRRIDRINLLKMPERIIKDFETPESGTQAEDLDPFEK